MKDSRRHRRIAAEFATKPYRILCRNQPLSWGDGSPSDLSLDPKALNISLAESLVQSQAPIIYADDVLETVERDGESVFHSINMADVPSASPPFDKMFVEVNFSHTSTVGKENWASCVGSFIQSDPFEKAVSDEMKDLIKSHGTNLKSSSESAFGDSILSRLAAAMKMPKHILQSGLIREDTLDCIENGKFVSITPFLFAEFEESEICVGPLGMIVYLVDPNKGLVRVKENESRKYGLPFMIHLSPFESKEGADSYQTRLGKGTVTEIANFAANFSLRTMSLLNCRNVEIEHTGNTLDNLTNKEKRAARVPSLKHYELRVKINGGKLRVSGKSSTGERRMGMVMGHYRSYKDSDSGLFGKPSLKGEYWIPPHVRGNAERGIITKDVILDTSSEASDA